MTIDCRRYSAALQKSKRTLDFLWNKSDDKKSVAVDFSVSSGIPLIVVFMFFIEFYDNTQVLVDSCPSLIDFYKYSKIIDFDGQDAYFP
jgi:hypothetical protein